MKMNEESLWDMWQTINKANIWIRELKNEERDRKLI
jgi:hypothetical protein